MKLTDIAPLEQWRQLEEDLHERFGLNASVTDGKGGLLTGFHGWGNQLCKAIRTSKGQGAICAVAGQAFHARGLEEKAPFVEVCDAMMSKICVPVVVDGEMLGMVGGCGVLTDGEEVEEYGVSMATGLDDDKVSELAGTVREMDGDKVAEVMAFICARLGEMLKASGKA